MMSAFNISSFGVVYFRSFIDFIQSADSTVLINSVLSTPQCTHATVSVIISSFSKVSQTAGPWKPETTVLIHFTVLSNFVIVTLWQCTCACYCPGCESSFNDVDQMLTYK